MKNCEAAQGSKFAITAEKCSQQPAYAAAQSVQHAPGAGSRERLTARAVRQRGGALGREPNAASG